MVEHNWIAIAVAASLLGCGGAAAEGNRDTSPTRVARSSQEQRSAPAVRAERKVQRPPQFRSEHPDETGGEQDARTAAPIDIELCSVEVPGVRAEATPFDGGMGIVITTDRADQVDALRVLARRLQSERARYAIAANAGAREPSFAQVAESSLSPSEPADAVADAASDDSADPYADLEKVGSNTTAPVELVAVRLQMQNIDGGVFLIVTATDPRRGSDLADGIRRDVEELAAGRCRIGDEWITAVVEEGSES